MSIATLHAYINHLRDNRQDASRYEIALWNKIIYPAAAPIMLLLALAFAYRPPRSGGAGGRLLLGVLLGLGFHLINRLVAQVAQLLDWSPPVAAIVPVLLIGSAAYAAVWWQESR
jgi:lipopolysaccharide export system permease protein